MIYLNDFGVGTLEIYYTAEPVLKLFFHVDIYLQIHILYPIHTYLYLSTYT